MSALLRAKSPMLRDGKKQDCCVVSEELRTQFEQLKSECGTYRSQERDFAYILETLIFLDDSYQQQSEEKAKMKKEFGSKIESNKIGISTLRKQIDEQKILLIERKMECVEIITEFEETQESTQ